MEQPKFDPEREREFVARGWWRDDTLARWLARHASERPDVPAIVHAEGVLAWKDLAARVSRLAEGLRRAGVGRGDVVAVQLPNLPEFVVAYLAICRLGAAMMTLHMPYRGAEIEALVRHGRAGAAVCLAQAKDWSPAEVFLGISSLRSVIAVGPPVARTLSFSALESSPPLADSHPQPEGADPFLLLYTSGTTAAPKGVPHPYRTMLGNARLGATEHRLGAGDRILSAAPFSHLYGLYSLHCAWAVGAASVLLPAFTPADLASVVEKNRPTALWTAPAHVAACRAAGLFEKHDWSSLQLAIVSGSIAPPELVRELAAKVPGCAVTQLWGMTELQAALYTRPGDPLEVSATTAGRPSPGTEVRISADSELQVRGGLMFSGYFDNPGANEAAFTPDGWFRSGDLAAMDAQGNVAITGRLKDIVNRGGVKFNPAEVEVLLDSHPKISQSAIVPMPDPVLGERACAFVTLRPGAEAPTLEELSGYLLAKNIARFKLPEKLVVLPEMPLTPTRKIIKGKLRVPG
jgi:acyl-CoA synthetase (AMP-forming)/AMP-acid ligase II